MRNSILFFCFVLLEAWAYAEDGVVDVANNLEVDALGGDIELTPRPCFTKSVTPVSCEGVEEDGLMAHPDDCRLFYHCSHEWALCQECPSGLHFNPELHVCDYPEEAGCQLPSS